MKRFFEKATHFGSESTATKIIYLLKDSFKLDKSDDIFNLEKCVSLLGISINNQLDYASYQKLPNLEKDRIRDAICHVLKEAIQDMDCGITSDLKYSSYVWNGLVRYEMMKDDKVLEGDAGLKGPNYMLCTVYDMCNIAAPQKTLYVYFPENAFKDPRFLDDIVKKAMRNIGAEYLLRTNDVPNERTNSLS